MELEEIEVKTVKPISEYSIDDIDYTLDKSKTYEEQAEDLVSAMATAKAVTNEATTKDIIEKKSEELKAKADKKLQDAQTENIKSTVERQEAERQKNEAVLQTFGITKHLPDWLLRTMVIFFSPIYILLTIAIGIPCGIVKVLIDNIDNILVRYETAKTTYKPKIKITIWVVGIIIILGAILLTILKLFDKI